MGHELNSSRPLGFSLGLNAVSPERRPPASEKLRTLIPKLLEASLVPSDDAGNSYSLDLQPPRPSSTLLVAWQNIWLAGLGKLG